jgi:hypothetical protein
VLLFLVIDTQLHNSKLNVKNNYLDLLSFLQLVERGYNGGLEVVLGEVSVEHVAERDGLGFLHLQADRARIFKLLGSQGIDSKESIPPVYVAWRAGTTTLYY